MTEEQAVAMLEHLAAIRGALLVCAKAGCWLLGYCLLNLVFKVVSGGTGFFGRPKL